MPIHNIYIYSTFGTSDHLYLYSDIGLSHLEVIEVLLQNALLGAECLSNRRDFQAKSSHALRLSNERQNLWVKVHVELLRLWMADQE